MKIKKLVDKYCDCNTYVVIKEDKAILIDASIDEETLEETLSKFGNPKIVGIFITHSHFDHVFNLDRLLEKYSCNAYIEEGGKEYLYHPDKSLSFIFGVEPFKIENKKNIKTIKDGDIIEIFPYPVKVYATPGHSSCSVCFEVGDVLFTGDTLFDRCIGRSDFFSSNVVEQLASLEKLRDLPPYSCYYSGHGKDFDYPNAEKTLNTYIRWLSKNR